MHEASLAADLVCRIKEIAHAQGVQRVLSVRIQVDGWSILSRDHLQDHFALVSRGTVAEGARLEVKAADEDSFTGGMGLLLESLEVVV